MEWRKIDAKRGLAQRSCAQLQFRIVDIGYVRNDERISKETEIVRIPSVEVKPRTGRSDTFNDDAQKLWFCFRILISFRFRQIVWTLSEFEQNQTAYLTKWNSLEIQPKATESNPIDRPVVGKIEPFLATGAARLVQLYQHREAIHAAVFRYADSFRETSIEAGLTSCVEAIEQLIVAFEASYNLNQDIIEQKIWKKIHKALKQSLAQCELASESIDEVKAHLGVPPKLRLEARIERMIHHYQKHWDVASQQLSAGLSKLIKVRNDIVHGRMVAEIDLTP